HVEIGTDGNFWAGNFEGLWDWNGTQWTRHQSPGPTGNWVQGMGMRGSTLYYASRFNGVCRFDGTSWRSFLPDAGVVADTTFRGRDFFFGLLVESGGDVWIGHWGQGIARLDDSSEPPNVRYYYGPEQGNFDERNTFGWASALDPSGNLWVG